MMRTMLLKLAAGVGVAAAVPTAIVLSAAREDRQFPDRSPATVEPASDGRAAASLGEDGIRFRLDAADARGGRGNAGVSVGPDGIHLDLTNEGRGGRGGVSVSVTDDGIRLRFHADGSR